MNMPAASVPCQEPFVPGSVKMYVYDQLVLRGLARNGKVLEDIEDLAKLAAKPDPQKKVLLGYRVKFGGSGEYDYLAQSGHNWVSKDQAGLFSYEDAVKWAASGFGIVRVVRKVK